MKVNHQDQIFIDGEPLCPTTGGKTYLLYNKPAGIDCVCDLNNAASIVHQIKFKHRIFPVGRLDKDSHGLMLLTNDGDLCHRVLHPDHHHEKEYKVTVDRPIDPLFCQAMAKGVSYKKVKTRPCQINQISKSSFKITLTQGLNRQIRHMCKALGYTVTDLQRIRLMNLKLDNLSSNVYRHLTDEERIELFNAV